MEETSYTYEVAAVYGGGSVEGNRSKAIVVTTLPDTTAPVLLHVTTESYTSVRLAFSESLDPSSTETVMNYVIDHDVKIEDASIQTDQRIVVLTTSVLSPDIDYIVQVNRVKDQAKVGNSIANDSSQQFQHGLVRKFLFQQSVGSIVKDIAQGKDAVIKGSINSLSNEEHPNLWLNGLSTFIDLGGRIIENRPQFSAEAWINVEERSESSCQMIIAQQQDVVQRYRWSLYIQSGKLYFAMNNESGEHQVLVGDCTTPSILIQTWSHIAVTRHDHEFVLYLNGKRIAASQSEVYLTQPANPNHMYIGAELSAAGNGPSHLFKGGIGEVRLYNIALTEEQIRMHSTQGM